MNPNFLPWPFRVFWPKNEAEVIRFFPLGYVSCLDHKLNILFKNLWTLISRKNCSYHGNLTWRVVMDCLVTCEEDNYWKNQLIYSNNALQHRNKIDACTTNYWVTMWPFASTRFMRAISSLRIFLSHRSWVFTTPQKGFVAPFMLQ